MKKRILAMIMAIVMCFSLLPAGVLADEPLLGSGSCGVNGDNITWELGNDYVLRFYGEGEMQSYAQGEAPWSGYADDIVDIVIDEDITSIGAYAFYGFSRLEIFGIPDYVCSVGTAAFGNCRLLSSFSTGDGLTAFSTDVIEGSTAVEVLIIGMNVASIEFPDKYSFTALNDIHVTLRNPYYATGDCILFTKDWKTLVYYPLGCTETSYAIPEGTETIGYGAFNNYSLTDISFPKSVSCIQSGAFDNCPFLQNVKFEGEAPTSVDADAFGTLSSCESFLVPACYRDSWESSEYYDNGTWCGFPLSFYDCEHSYTAEVTAPSCTEKGFTTYTCSKCGCSYVDSYVDELGHDVVNGECTRCDYTETVLIASGYCGGDTTAGYDSASGAYKNLRWTLDDEGTLTISGVGEMMGYYTTKLNDVWITVAPWGKYYAHITNAVIEAGVTNIGKYAFYNCSMLESVTIPDSVTSIDRDAFRKCSSLDSVTIPDSVITIADSAFVDCIGLTSVIIPDSVMHVGQMAFFGCSNLTKVYISDLAAWCNTTSDTVFNYYYDLYLNGEIVTDLNIPNSVTNIGEGAFANCNSLTSVTIPNSVTSIGHYAFNSCDFLESVTMSDGLTAIGSFAFTNCRSLTSIEIPDSVTSIGERAFSFNGLASATFDGNAPSYFGGDVFDYCAYDFTIYAPNGYTSWTSTSAYDAEAGTWNGYPIEFYSVDDAIVASGYCGGDKTAEYDPASEAYKNLSWTLDINGTLTISGVGEMEEYDRVYINYSYVGATPWKQYLSKIKDVVLNYGVTSIGNYAFRSCDNLAKVSIPNSVTSIGVSAFSSCSSLSSVTIPNSVTSIGYYAFAYCSNITSVSIPCGVENIYDQTFYYCKSLTNLTIGDGVTSIGSQAFGECSELTSVSIPSSVSRISSTAFVDNAKLTEINVSEDNLYYCSKDGILFNKSLTELVIYPAGKTDESYTIPSSVTRIASEAFYRCSNLTSITIPDGIMSIYDLTFCECTGLTSIRLPNGITSLGAGAFNSCSRLKSIIIPSSIQIIGDYAFENCSGITDICFCGTNEEWNRIIIGVGNEYLTDANPQYHNYVNGVCTYCGHIYGATNIIASGYCGGNTSADFDSVSGTYKNLYWTIDADGLMTISGVGAMADFGKFDEADDFDDLPAPWYPYAELVTQIKIEDGVTSIGRNAFYGMANLCGIETPESINDIGEDAFRDTPIYNNDDNWSDGGFYIDDKLVQADEDVETVVVKPGTKIITGQAFWNCKNVTKVTLPEGVESIGSEAFKNCSKLTEIEIPTTVTSIGDSAFEGCTMLKKALFKGDAPTDFGTNVFDGCAESFKILAPANDMTWRDSYFYDEAAQTWCDYPIEFYSVGPEIVASGYCGGNTSAAYDTLSGAYKNLRWMLDVNGTLTISGTGEMIDYTGVNADSTWFTTAPWGSYYADIKKIVTEPGVTSIGNYAFYQEYGESHLGLTNLEAVELNEDLVRIGEGAFFSCEKLTSIILPETLREIGEAAFAGCLNLVEADIHGNLTSIGDNAFEYCQSLESIVLPDSLTSIGDYAFAYCESLKSVVLPDDLTSIGIGVFGCCKSLENVVLPDKLTSIGDDAFNYCQSLESIVFPDSLTSIGNYAFWHCESLTQLEIPGSITDIGMGAFEYNTNVSDLIIHDGVKKIGTFAFGNCYALKELNIPDSVTDIGIMAFWACNGLTEVTLPDSVTRLGGGAFHLCENLESIVIPAGVRVLEVATGALSSKLKSVKFLGDAPEYQPTDIYDENTPISPEEIAQYAAIGVFYGTDPDFTIYAPAGNETWLDPEAYDAAAQTWHGYHIAFYSNDPESIGGDCGEDATWELSFDGTLTISGSGSIDFSDAPWKDYADKITTIEINSDISDIDFNAFKDLKNLENINISRSNRKFSSINGVVYNKNANELLYCPKGKTGEYEVHGGLKVIKAYAFANCTKLKVIVIANSITTVEDNAFYGCTSLVNVAFTDSEPNTVGNAIFDNCAPDFCISAINQNGKWLKSARYDAKTQTWNGYPIRFGEKTIVDSDNSDDIRWDVDKYGNLEIVSNGAMSTAADLSNIRADVKTATIAEGTTSIAAGLFEDFENLEAVNIPDSVEEIGDGAFSGCENLVEVSIPASVEEIGDGAFAGCKSLTEINVDENNPNYSSIDGNLYNKDGSELLCVPSGAGDRSFTVPETVDIIGDGAFAECDALTEVVMYEGITEIGDGAFAECENLNNIKIVKPAPKRLLMAVRSNTAPVVASVSLPDSVTIIGSNAFRGCNCINTINISANVTAIGSGAFADCENLTAVNVSADNANYCSVNGMLLSKNGKILLCVPAGLSGELTLPESVTTIADGALDGCTAELILLCPNALKGCFFGKCSVKFAGDGEVHSYELLVVAPTCTEAGYTVVITDGVEGEHSDITEKLPHKYGAWHVTKAASCTENGVKERVCVCCGDVQTCVIDCGHSYSYVVIPATCTTNGCTRYTCSGCGDSFDSDITPACHDIVHHGGQAASCTEDGWEEYDTCRNCDYSTYKVIPAAGHSFGEWFVVNKPGCTKNGLEKRVCSCGAEETRSVAALGHSTEIRNAKEATCTEKGYSGDKVCTVCGETVEKGKTTAALGHDYVNHKCTRCGADEPEQSPNVITKLISSITSVITNVINSISNFFKNLFR